MQISDERVKETFIRLMSEYPIKAGFIDLLNLPKLNSTLEKELIEQKIDIIYQSKDKDEVIDAIFLLQFYKNERIVDCFINRLQNENNPIIRKKLVLGLGAIGLNPEKVLPIFENLLNQETNREILRKIPDAIIGFGSTAEPLLYKFVFNKKGLLRFLSVLVLTNISLEEEKLIELFSKELKNATEPYERTTFAFGLIVLEGLESDGLLVLNELIKNNLVSDFQMSYIYDFYKRKMNDEKILAESRKKLQIIIQKIKETHENTWIEFKESLLGGSSNPKRNRFSKIRIARSIAAFLNTKGGILFIGVDDKGEFIGLNKDYSAIKNTNKRDEYRKILTEVIKYHIGLSFIQLIEINFKSIYGKDICMIKVERSPVLAPLKDSNETVNYVIRTDNSIHILDDKSLKEYSFIRENILMRK